LNSLVVGSSSGLGRKIFESISESSLNVYGVSRYRNIDTFEHHLAAGNARRVDLLNFNSQSDFHSLISQLPSFKRIYLCIGGGYGIHNDLPSFEETLLLHKLNSFIPSSIVNSLFNLEKLDSESTIFFISSIATDEITASTGYSSAKSSLNVYSKCIAQKIAPNLGAVVLVKLGAIEGSGTSFDRLKLTNPTAYTNFVSSRLPYGRPMDTSQVASTLINLSTLPTQILDGMSITIHANESLAL
jgi:NAD(P)-dependent dehydrogenase (short-subunit alcohol dehydrogenase family)